MLPFLSCTRGIWKVALDCPLNVVKVLHNARRFTLSRTALKRYLHPERQLTAGGDEGLGEA